MGCEAPSWAQTKSTNISKHRCNSNQTAGSRLKYNQKKQEPVSIIWVHEKAYCTLRLLMKGAASEIDVSGTSMNRVPLRGSGRNLVLADDVHLPATKWTTVFNHVLVNDNDFGWEYESDGTMDITMEGFRLVHSQDHLCHLYPTSYQGFAPWRVCSLRSQMGSHWPTQTTAEKRQTCSLNWGTRP